MRKITGFRGTSLPADSGILQYLYRDGGVRGERIAMRFRWLLVVLLLVLILVMFINGHKQEAGWSIIPVSIFICCNIFLVFVLRKDRIVYRVRYVSVIVDVGVLSLHIQMYSRMFSEIAATVTASIYCDEDMFRTILRNLISNGIKE